MIDNTAGAGVGCIPHLADKVRIFGCRLSFYPRDDGLFRQTSGDAALSPGIIEVFCDPGMPRLENHLYHLCD